MAQYLLLKLIPCLDNCSVHYNQHYYGHKTNITFTKPQLLTRIIFKYTCFVQCRNEQYVLKHAQAVDNPQSEEPNATMYIFISCDNLTNIQRDMVMSIHETMGCRITGVVFELCRFDFFVRNI